MSLRNVFPVLVVVTALSLGACSGGGGGSSSLGLPEPSSPANGAATPTATLTYVLASAASTYRIPPISGFDGSLALPAVSAPAHTRLALTSSLEAPGGAPILPADERRAQATGTLNVYFYETIQLTNTVTFSSLPGFSVTLPKSINPAGLQFLYAISNPTPTNGAEQQFRTEGPATLSGQTLTFPPSATPLTLLAGVSYVIALYAVTGVSPTPAPGTVTEYSAGISPNPQLAGIAAGSDGNLWFCEGAGRIGRITPSGIITEFSAGITPGSSPNAITAGPDGNVWFTQNSATSDQIGRITPSGTVAEFSADAPSYAQLTGITGGYHGNIWFSEVENLPGNPPIGRIVRMTPSGVVTKYNTPRPLEGVNGITTGPDGNLWFTEELPFNSEGRIGKVTPFGFYEYGLSDEELGPAGITSGSDGNLWFTLFGYHTGGGIGRITPSGSFTEVASEFEQYALTGSIASGPDGSLWLTARPISFEPPAFGIVRITASGTTTFFTRGISTAPVAITAGPDGNLWFTESGGKIGKIVP